MNTQIKSKTWCWCIAICWAAFCLLVCSPLAWSLPARKWKDFSLPVTSDIQGQRSLSSGRKVAESSDDPLLKEAERLFIEGRQLARRGEYSRAVAKFLASYRIVPSRKEARYQKIRSTLLFFIGRSYQLQKQNRQAGTYYRRFLQTSPEPKTRQLALDWLKEMWPSLRAVVVLTGADGIQCSVTEPRGTRDITLPTRIEVEAGMVRLVCRADGFQEKTLQFQVEPQSEPQQEVVLLPKPTVVTPVTPTPRNLQWIGWVVFGTGVVVAGVGGIFGGMSSAARSSGESAIEQAEKTKDVAFTRQALQAEQQAQQHATTANVMFGVGGGVAILGIILYFVLKPRTTSVPLSKHSPRAAVRMNRRMHSDETWLVSPFFDFSFVATP